jgi:hypothetical protein
MGISQRGRKRRSALRATFALKFSDAGSTTPVTFNRAVSAMSRMDAKENNGLPALVAALHDLGR